MDHDLLTRAEAFLDLAPGGLESDTSDYYRAINGDSNYAIRRYEVSEQNYYSAMGGMTQYATDHPTYWTYRYDCTHAALWALNSSGILANGVWSNPIATPSMLYTWIQKMNAQ